jgi:hypothetical protein
VRCRFGPAAHAALGEAVYRVLLESVWVEATAARGQSPCCVYRGEPLTMPRFIDPARLRLDSPVSFTPEHVWPAAS